jgi:hypothetical protein
LPDVYRSLHCGDFVQTLVDPQSLLDRLATLATAGHRGRWIETWRLPTTYAEQLYGRETEMAALLRAWDSQGPAKTNVLVLDAMGGTGKTALMRYFLDAMGERGWPGVEAVYVWSFYSQGTDDARAVSAETFLDTALDWFGHDGSPLPTQADKGVRLAELIASRRTLLILDGLEPLQYPAGRTGGGPTKRGVTGSLKEEGLKALVLQLAVHNPGLLLATTRLPIYELQNFKSPAVIRHPLSRLDKTAGTQLLRRLGVVGETADLEATVGDFRGHALALTQVGLYLANYYDGDIRRRDTIPSLMELDGQQERDPFRVMSAYERHLHRQAAEAGSHAADTAAGRQLNVLFLIGIFDRPAELEAIDVLLAAPVIPGLTDHLVGGRDTKWRSAVNALRRLNLLADSKGTAAASQPLDAHPLVREYFGQRLREEHPAAWKAAHLRLWKHYEARAKKIDAQTAEEMTPAVQAIAHATQADQCDAAAGLYEPKIKGKISPRGLYEFDISVLLAFFEDPWRQLRPGISAKRQSMLLRQAQFSLQRSGRLVESAEAGEQNCVVLRGQGLWGQYLDQRVELIQVLIKLGRLRTAIDEAKDALATARTHKVVVQEADILCYLAHAHHLAGEMSAAAKRFAESTRAARGDTGPHLSSLRQLAFNEYHLDLGTDQSKDVVRRWTKRVLEVARSPRELALDQLSLARLSLLEAETEADPVEQASRFAEASTNLEESIIGLRQTNQRDELPRALLLRAQLRRLTSDHQLAAKDLREVLYISEQFNMPLFRVDAYLELAALEQARRKPLPDLPSADCLERAEKLMAETGYERRRQQLEALRREQPGRM